MDPLVLAYESLLRHVFPPPPAKEEGQESESKHSHHLLSLGRVIRLCLLAIFIIGSFRELTLGFLRRDPLTSVLEAGIVTGASISGAIANPTGSTARRVHTLRILNASLLIGTSVLLVSC